jgi:hypothetical protein
VQDDHDKQRSDFLMHMYDQMFNDINTHILVVWQSVGVLIGAFAIFALVEKKIITFDLSSALIVMLGAWLVAHLYDASYWYNRNLVIIANIERQFLVNADLNDIHYYFGKHRKTSSMITHLRIQYLLAVGIVSLVLYYHFTKYFWPVREHIVTWHVHSARLTVLLPYAVLIIAIVLLWYFRTLQADKYRKFVANSPGRALDTQGVKYGRGHPVDSEPG